MSWRVAMWPCELREAIKQVLRRGDMTVLEIKRELEAAFNVAVPYQALNSILKVTRGVYVKHRVPSPFCQKLVFVYTVGLLMEAG